MNRWFRPCACVAALTVLMTACAGGGPEHTSKPPASAIGRTLAGTGPAEEPVHLTAAAVREKLTLRLRVGVGLIAFVTQTVKSTGFHSAATDQAIRVLHHNGSVLVELVISVSGGSDDERGRSERRRLTSLWNDRVEYLVDYIEGAVTGNRSAKSTARTRLFETDAHLAEVFADVTEDIVLPEEARGLLGTLLGHTLAMIEQIAGGEQTAPKSIVRAARSASELATKLSRGFDSDPTALAGSAISEASTLRADLTGLLVQHVTQTVTLAHVATVTGIDSARTRTAVRTLRQNAARLAERIGSVYGPEAAERFNGMFEPHVTALVEYAKARASKPRRPVTSGPSPTRAPSGIPPSMERFPARFTDYAVRLTDGTLRAQRFEETLRRQLGTVLTAVAAVAGTGSAAAKEVMAAETAPATVAGLLATAVTRQLPEDLR